MLDEFQILFSVAVGLALAAACGFRVFVPLFLIGAANATGYLGLSESFEWMGSQPALIVLGAATAFEILAFYVPFVDNLLDTIATPAAVVAGILATATQVGELDPVLGWAVAIIGGGSSAGVVQTTTAAARQLSSVATAGFGNPILSTFELGGAVLTFFLSLFLPVLVLLLLGAFTLFVARRVSRRKRAEDAIVPA